MPDRNPDQGVIDFLTEQLKRREDERVRRNEQLVRTHAGNLATLASTWRFIIVTRVLSLALGLAGLQFILLHAPQFLDPSALLPILENFFGKEVGFVARVRIWSPSDAALLIGVIVTTIVFFVVASDVLLARLQTRCRERGVEAETYLQIRGLFTEIRMLRGLIGLPFWLARITLLAFVIVLLAQLGNALQ